MPPARPGRDLPRWSRVFIYHRQRSCHPTGGTAMIPTWVAKFSPLLVRVASVAAILSSATAPGLAQAQMGAGQITVLYDAFGKTSTMTKDWGFSALIEYGGKRILFDTGNNADI